MRRTGALRSSCGSPAPSAVGTSLAGKRNGALGGELALQSCVGGLNPGGEVGDSQRFCAAADRNLIMR